MSYRWILTLLWLAQSAFAHTGKIDDILTRISDLYVEEKPLSQLKDDTIRHIISDLDPHSSYLPLQTANHMKDALSGEYFGIGMSVRLEKQKLIIDTIMPNSPAQKAKLQPNDVITHINKNPINPTSLEHNMLNLRSKNSGYILLTINDSQEVKIKREKINRDFVQYQNIDNIGYIQIFLFNKKTTNELIDLIENTNHKAYLIDLRHNPGGLLYTSIESASLFLEPDADRILTHIQNREGLHEVYLQDNKPDILKGKPLYILIGPYSASGSELFTSILQYYSRATVLGQTSKGKGSIQSLIPLEDKSLLKLTTAYFTAPDGTVIHQHGITPNIYINIDSHTSSLTYISRNML